VGRDGVEKAGMMLKPVVIIWACFPPDVYEYAACQSS
jgi:hypothetical protein